MSDSTGAFDPSSPSLEETRVRAALADRYTVVRRIGSGGMATVYLAEDPKHQRQVAVKVLRAELSSALGAERFLREIRIAAKLQHPHILPLLDSGEASGLLYYVMPYVQGESLRQRLHREGQLPIADVTRLLRDVTDALAYAHAQNVVHRDVKPDNIMLSGRYALLMDFGVAKAVSQAAEGGQSTLTTRGISIGTPAYMAPEQAVADPNIDHRADIYAVGIVAYELLTGGLPFAATSPETVLSAHVMEKPTPVTERRTDVPAPLARLVMRCLEKKREDRWQKADDLVQQLEALVTPSGGTQPVAGIKKPRYRVAVAAGVSVVAVAAVWIGSRIIPSQVTVNPTYKQLTFSGRVWEAAISPDGRYVAYTEGPLLLESAYRRVRNLVLKEVAKGDEIRRGTFLNEIALTWSGDGSNVVVVGGSVGDSSSDSGGTWLVPVIGSVPRRIARGIAVSSPDGRRVAGFGDGFGVLLVRTLGPESAETVTVRLSGNGFGSPVWSPDGRALAILVSHGDSTSLELVIPGKSQSPLLGTEVTPLAFAWVGEAIYYTRRSGTVLQLWKISIPDPSRARGGRPRLLIPELDRSAENSIEGLGNLDVSADGRRLIFVRVVQRDNLYLSTLGSSLTGSSALTTSTSYKGGMRVSPDGRQVAFSSGSPNDQDIYTVPLDGGSPRQITSLRLQQGANVEWSPDGKEIAFCANDGSGWHLWTVSASGGAPHKLASARPIPWSYLSWGPRGQIVYIGNGVALEWPHVLDRATERDRPLIRDDSTPNHFGVLRISPDGQQLSIYWLQRDGEGLWTISLTDSTRRQLIAGPASPMRWSTTGDTVFALRSNEVLRIPTKGGAASVVGRFPKDWTCVDFDITPDGRRFVCSKDETQRDAWMIENFDPDVPQAKTDE